MNRASCSSTSLRRIRIGHLVPVFAPIFVGVAAAFQADLPEASQTTWTISNDSSSSNTSSSKSSKSSGTYVQHEGPNDIVGDVRIGEGTGSNAERSAVGRNVGISLITDTSGVASAAKSTACANSSRSESANDNVSAGNHRTGGAGASRKPPPPGHRGWDLADSVIVSSVRSMFGLPASSKAVTFVSPAAEAARPVRGLIEPKPTLASVVVPFSTQPASDKPSRDTVMGTTASTHELLVVLAIGVVGFVTDSIILLWLGAAPSPGPAIVLFFWVAVALVYSLVFGMFYGRETGMEWIDGYVLEWSLSLDNLFVFCLIFRSFRTPPRLQPIALLYWVPVGALSRLLLYTVLESIFDNLGWVRILCGLVLIYSAASAAFTNEDDDVDVNDFTAVQMLCRCLGKRLSNSYDEKMQRLFIWVNGQLCASRLVIVVITLWVADLVFAIDGVGARVSEIPNQYIAFSSTMLAMFSMRAFGVFLEDLVETFSLLKYGICAVLAMLGVQLVLCGLPLGIKIPPKVSGDLVCILLGCCIGVDLLKRLCSSRPRPEMVLEAPVNKHVLGDGTKQALS